MESTSLRVYSDGKLRHVMTSERLKPGNSDDQTSGFSNDKSEAGNEVPGLVPVLLSKLKSASGPG